MGTLEIAAKAIVAFALAFFVESFVEYACGGLWNLYKARRPEAEREALDQLAPLKYVALAAGLALAFAYRLDLIYEATGIRAAWPATGIALTGLGIGRGANWLHDFWKAYLSPR